MNEPNNDPEYAEIVYICLHANCLNKLDLVNINAFTKFSQNLSICSKDNERKRNSDVNQGPKLCY